MPTPLKSFMVIFGVLCLFGLLVGTLNLMNPKAVFIPFGPNGESAEGLDGIITSVASSAVLGVVFGGIAAILAVIFRSGVKRMKNDKTIEKDS
jgi:phosphotransferase system  glucose/maltose/N-acetylglucosamine-specific IIC component